MRSPVVHIVRTAANSLIHPSVLSCPRHLSTCHQNVLHCAWAGPPAHETAPTKSGHPELMQRFIKLPHRGWTQGWSSTSRRAQPQISANFPRGRTALRSQCFVLPWFGVHFLEYLQIRALVLCESQVFAEPVIQGEHCCAVSPPLCAGPHQSPCEVWVRLEACLLYNTTPHEDLPDDLLLSDTTTLPYWHW